MAEQPTALQKAVAFLARREHSQQELRSKLSTRDFDVAEIEQALAKLLERGLQSDERFAEIFVQSRVERGHGPVRIRAELGQRGVDEAVANSAISTVIDAAGYDWFELATTCYLKKYGDTRPVDYKDSSRRLRFLQQRGFSAEQCREAVERAAIERTE